VNVRQPGSSGRLPEGRFHCTHGPAGCYIWPARSISLIAQFAGTSYTRRTMWCDENTVSGLCSRLVLVARSYSELLHRDSDEISPLDIQNLAMTQYGMLTAL